MADPSETAPLVGLPPGAAEISVPEPCLLVIFGASGDLTRRKLVPALFGLHRERILPAGFFVLGVSRTPHTDESFLARWRENPGRDLYFYLAGTWGPREADTLLTREGRRWRTP